MGKTLCAICDGYGHSHKICPTNRKLKHFSKAGLSQTIIKRAKDRSKQRISRVNRAQLAPWSCIPAAGHKRPGKMLLRVEEDVSTVPSRRPRLNSLS